MEAIKSGKLTTLQVTRSPSPTFQLRQSLSQVQAVSIDLTRFTSTKYRGPITNTTHSSSPPRPSFDLAPQHKRHSMYHQRGDQPLGPSKNTPPVTRMIKKTLSSRNDHHQRETVGGYFVIEEHPAVREQRRLTTGRPAGLHLVRASTQSNTMLSERPQSQQLKKPWEQRKTPSSFHQHTFGEGSSNSSAQRRPKAIGVQGFEILADSCEASADEQESVQAASDEFDENQQCPQRMWDHFPDPDDGSSPLSQQDAQQRMASVDHTYPSAVRQPNISCELLGFQPTFVKQNSKGSLDLDGKKEKKRNTFYSPVRPSLGFMQEGGFLFRQPRRTLNPSVLNENGFSSFHQGTTARQEDQTSAQKIPKSRQRSSLFEARSHSHFAQPQGRTSARRMSAYQQARVSIQQQQANKEESNHFSNRGPHKMVEDKPRKDKQGFFEQRPGGHRLTIDPESAAVRRNQPNILAPNQLSVSQRQPSSNSLSKSQIRQQALAPSLYVQVEDNYFDEMNPKVDMAEVACSPELRSKHHLMAAASHVQNPSRKRDKNGNPFAANEGFASDYYQRDYNPLMKAVRSKGQVNQSAAAVAQSSQQHRLFNSGKSGTYAVPIDESPLDQQHKQYRQDPPIFVMMSNMKRSPSNHTNNNVNQNGGNGIQVYGGHTPRQDRDDSESDDGRQSPVCALSSQRDLMSVARAPTRCLITTEHEEEGTVAAEDEAAALSDDSIFGDSGVPQVTAPQKPIVPKEDYIPKADDHQARILAAALKKPDALPADSIVEAPQALAALEQQAKDDQPQLNWLQSLSLSVTQLFSGNGEDQGAAAQLEARQRRASSNCEVPIDEEVSQAEADSKHGDVVHESTRVHQGNEVRKKILFMDQVGAGGVVSRKKGPEANLKVSLISAQSYNAIESGSDNEGDLASGNASSSFVRNKENAISYTTSQKDTTSPVKKQSYNGQPRFQRQHSSSMHEQLRGLGSSFQNLAVSLLPSQNLVLGEDRDLSGQAQLKDPVTPEKSVEQSQQERFGFMSRLFDRVVKNSNQNDQAMLQFSQSDQKLLRSQAQIKGGAEDSIDYFAPHLMDKSPERPARGKGKAVRKLFKESQPEVDSQHFARGGRPHSKTIQLERQPFLHQPNPASSVREKLLKVDKIVFNQDKSHFAVVWAEGGFTKFDVATLQVIHKVRKVPPYIPQSLLTASEADLAEQITLTSPQLGGIPASSRYRRHTFSQSHHEWANNRDEVPGIEPLVDLGLEADEDAESEADTFSCVALQHRTKDYMATLARNPTQVISVHIISDTSVDPQFKQRGVRTDVKYFTEEVSRIEILPGARFTLICLQSAIYIYKKNTRELFDIVACCEPHKCSAVPKSILTTTNLQQSQQRDSLVLAYLSKDESSESVTVHDYSVNPVSQTDTVFTVPKPFSAGYKVGGVQLDEAGKRVVVVSADGCFIYLYELQDPNQQVLAVDTNLPAPENDTVSQDMAAPEHATPAAEEFSHGSQVVLSAPQQSFARSSSSCKEIYLPIQIVEGFSVGEHACDFVLLSSSSMTSHLFALKSAEEVEQLRTQQKEASWTFSRLLPTSFQLERSKIRLNIQEELALPQAANRESHLGARDQKPSASLTELDHEPITQPGDCPYTCFVESSGLLVAISHAGYCCKFSIDLQHEASAKGGAIHSVRASGRQSPPGRQNLNASYHLGQSLAQLKDLPPPVNSLQRRASKARQRFKSPDPSTDKDQASTTPSDQLQIETSTHQSLISLPTSPNKGSQSQVRLDTHLSHSYKALATSKNHLSVKKATAFSGYKQPTLRLKFKIKDFFSQVDHKSESLKRIRRREFLQQRTLQLKQRALFLSQRAYVESKPRTQRKDTMSGQSKLKRLLSGV